MRFVFYVLVLMLAAACSRPPDEVRIRNAIEAMKTAAEARRPSGILDHLADDFTGNSGEVDREGLAQLLRIQFLRSDAIAVDVGPARVEIDEDRATATFDIAVSDGSRRWLPTGRETYTIVSGWRREGSDWICYNASWTSSGR